jgi:hypothetical protein
MVRCHPTAAETRLSPVHDSEIKTTTLVPTLCRVDSQHVAHVRLGSAVPPVRGVFLWPFVSVRFPPPPSSPTRQGTSATTGQCWYNHDVVTTETAAAPFRRFQQAMKPFLLLVGLLAVLSPTLASPRTAPFEAIFIDSLHRLQHLLRGTSGITVVKGLDTHPARAVDILARESRDVDIHRDGGAPGTRRNSS